MRRSSSSFSRWMRRASSFEKDMLRRRDLPGGRDTAPARTAGAAGIAGSGSDPVELRGNKSVVVKTSHLPHAGKDPRIYTYIIV